MRPSAVAQPPLYKNNRTVAAGAPACATGRSTPLKETR